MPGMELVKATRGGGVQVVDLFTGEALVINSKTTTDRLAEFIDHCKEVKAQVDEASKVAQDEVRARMDREAKWTADVGGYKLSAPSPAPKQTYDAEAIWKGLTELAKQRKLTRQARDQAVERKVTYKAKDSGLKHLVKLGGPVAELIKAHTTEEERTDRRVDVKIKKARDE